MTYAFSTIPEMFGDLMKINLVTRSCIDKLTYYTGGKTNVFCLPVYNSMYIVLSTINAKNNSCFYITDRRVRN